MPAPMSAPPKVAALAVWPDGNEPKSLAMIMSSGWARANRFFSSWTTPALTRKTLAANMPPPSPGKQQGQNHHQRSQQDRNPSSSEVVERAGDHPVVGMCSDHLRSPLVETRGFGARTEQEPRDRTITVHHKPGPRHSISAPPVFVTRVPCGLTSGFAENSKLPTSCPA